MHPTAYVERDARASARLVEEARKLAAQHGLDDLVKMVEAAGHRDPKYGALFQKEAVVNLLAAVNAAADDQPADEPAKKTEPRRKSAG